MHPRRKRQLEEAARIIREMRDAAVMAFMKCALAELPPRAGIITKQAALLDDASETEIDQTQMSVRCVVSTPDVDRVGDILIPDGAELDNFRRNPVVFFGHGEMPLPIGRAMDPAGNFTTKVVPGERIESVTWFSQSNPDAYQVFALIAEGMLPGVSIGFRPLSRPEQNECGGFTYHSFEVLEYSHVGVPCNPYCLVIGDVLTRGRIAGRSISPSLRRALEPFTKEDPSWSPKRRF